MKEKHFNLLSRRERQIMDIVYRNKSASAAKVQKELPDQPSYSTVRALLKILEEKGFIDHKIDGRKYIYYPLIARKKAVKTAVTRLLDTFFDNSIEQAVSALLEIDQSKLTEDDFDRLESLINKARKEEGRDD